jgi:hypothetical protein
MDLGAFVPGEAAETKLGIPNRRAQFDLLKTGVRQLLHRAGEIFLYKGPDSIRLAPDREAEWVCGYVKVIHLHVGDHRMLRNRQASLL